MRVACVQMCSTDDLAANLAATRTFVEQAAREGARWVALPENFAFLRREGRPIPCAQGLDGEIVGTVRELARRIGVWILGGSFAEAMPAGGKVHNTSFLVDDAGELVAVYRKIHLFDVDLREQDGDVYQESATIAPGEKAVVARTPFGGIGLSVCYDVRFPELYRRMADEDVRFLTIPAAFAVATGQDHWEVLLRARAIENLAYVVAPTQWGRHSAERASYGRGMIVDPWGLVLARAPDRPCVFAADCDPDAQDRIRASLPALSHRKL